MTWPDTTIEGKLFGVETKFSFIRPVKRFEKSYYKLSLYGNWDEISTCFKGTSLLEDVQNTIKENLDEAQPKWEGITLQVQIIYKPHSNKAKESIEEIKKRTQGKDVDKIKSELAKAKEEYNNKQREYIDKNKKSREKEDALKNLEKNDAARLAYKESYEAYKEVNRIQDRLNYLEGNHDKINSANKILEDSKENYNNSKEFGDVDLPNNRILIIGVKVDFGDMLSSENGSFKFTSFAVSFSYFGGEVSEDDKDSYKSKIDFIEGGDRSDEIFLKTQAIIEQNKFLQNLVLENVLKITSDQKSSEEAALENSLKDRIVRKWNSLDDLHKDESKLFLKSDGETIKKEIKAENDLKDKSFDELTFLSFQIYEASKKK
ncbi:hypothetical protein B4N84_07670 [Flavobacterium sp. IR1]|nr:hypothetical protein B4N84_07670 [Flavobacterium sp. IR1]